MSLRGCLAGLVVVVGLGLLLTAPVMARYQLIPAGYCGVLYSVSGLGKEVFPPKRIFVPWRHQLYIYPTMTRSARYTQDPTEGEDKSADGIQVTTKDNAQTMFDVTVFYHVEPANVPILFSHFSALPIEDIQRLHIRRAVAEAANVVGKGSDVFGLMGPDRNRANPLLLKETRARIAVKGITIDDAFFGAAAPQEGQTTKITARVNALTDLTIAETNNKLATILAQTAEIKARAETESARLTSAQSDERSLELLSLDTTVKALKKWKGHLSLYPGAHPTVVASGAAVTPKAVAVAETTGGAK